MSKKISKQRQALQPPQGVVIATAEGNHDFHEVVGLVRCYQDL